ncbi:MAG: hypothetical protein KDJ47_00255, partial [Hyphomicrobiaceae bacterium]|nr:hypothetical protein [Hyphomicrobiaceae bacterium]
VHAGGDLTALAAVALISVNKCWHLSPPGSSVVGCGRFNWGLSPAAVARSHGKEQHHGSSELPETRIAA